VAELFPKNMCVKEFAVRRKKTTFMLPVKRLDKAGFADKYVYYQ